MTSSATAAPNRARNIALIIAGTVIVLATYLYLVIAQPTELQTSSTAPAGLIAMAGYLIGAVLIAAGSIHRLSTTTIAMIPVAIALNIVVGQLVAVLGLPVYLDSMGTVLVSALAGPAAGVVTGILTNVIWGLILNPVFLPFAVVQVVIGMMAGYAARIGVFLKPWLPPIAGAITGIGCVLPKEVLHMCALAQAAAKGDPDARARALELESALAVLSSFDEGPDLVLYFKHMMVLKGDKVIKPMPDTRIEEGDIVCIFALTEDVPEVERLLQVAIDFF